MERELLGTWSIALTVLLVAASAASFGPVGIVAGNVENVENRPDAYAAEQGDRCIPITMVGDGDETVEDYYEYGTYYSSYSSQGTRDLQETGLSQLYVYRGERDDSLIFLNDETGDEAGGGSLSIEIRNIPGEASWPVEDDDYPNQDDRFSHDGATSNIDWKWYQNRTDGAALLGLAHANDSGIEVSGTFGEDKYFDEWIHADNELDWRVRSSDDGLVRLNKDEPVTIRQGTCTDAPTASVAGSPSDVTTGEEVSFDASSSSAIGDTTYQWDFDNDGSAETETEESTAETSFETTGSRTVRVTVVDGEGRTDSATTTVDVQAAGPTASLAGPSNATVEESVTFDASESTFNSDSATYRWDFDGDGSVERGTNGPSADTSFGATGSQTVRVTVVDGEGRTDNATTTVDVTEQSAAGPTAVLDAPANATAGVPVTFDASASVIAEANATYRWDFDGDGTVDEETEEATVKRIFDTLGPRTVGLAVVDGEGRANNTTATVDVTADYELTTAVSANQTTVEPGEAVAFTTNSTPATAVTAREFDFGDGDTESSENGQTTHSFESAGEYDVTHTATGEYGQTAAAEVAVTVENGDDGSSGGGGGGGGSSGGGGGSFSPPATDGSDDQEPTTVTTSDSGATIEVTEPGDSGTVAVELDDGTLGDGPVAVESITLTGVDAGTTVVFSDEPNGTSGPLDRSSDTVFGVDPAVKSGPSPSSISYRLAIDSDAVRDAGGSIDSATVATWNGSAWSRTNAGVAENESTATLEPTVTAEPMTVDIPTASVVSKELAVDGVPARDQPFTVRTTLLNRGNRSVTEPVNVTLDGQVVATKEVTVPANSSETVSIDVVPEETGTQRLAVGGQSRAIEVVPAEVSISNPTVSVTNDSVERGDSVTVVASFTNNGTAPGTVNASFSAFGERIDRQRVTVPAGESVTVRFSQRLEQSGEYSFTVNGEKATVTVAKSGATAETRTSEGSSNALPSIPVVVLVLGGMAGLAGTAVVLSRQFSTAD